MKKYLIIIMLFGLLSTLFSSFALANPMCAIADVVDCNADNTYCVCTLCGWCSYEPYTPDLAVVYQNYVEVNRYCTYRPVPCGWIKGMELPSR